MFLNHLSEGLSLWAISTAGGIIALYLIRRREERAENENNAQDGEDHHANEA